MAIFMAVELDYRQGMFIFMHRDQKFPARFGSFDDGFHALANQNKAPIHRLPARASWNPRFFGFQWRFEGHLCLVYRRSAILSLLLGLLLMLRLLHGTNFAVHLAQVSCRAESPRWVALRIVSKCWQC